MPELASRVAMNRNASGMPPKLAITAAAEVTICWRSTLLVLLTDGVGEQHAERPRR